jgi:hypothetical protein
MLRDHEPLDLGDSSGGGRKELLVYMDDEEGCMCDRCKKMAVGVPMLTMDGSAGVFGAPQVCEPCVLELFRLMREYNEHEKAKERNSAASTSE